MGKHSDQLIGSQSPRLLSRRNGQLLDKLGPMHYQSYPSSRRLKEPSITLGESVFERRGCLKHAPAIAADLQHSCQQGADSKLLGNSSQHRWIAVRMARRIDLTRLEYLDEPTTIGNRQPIQTKLDLTFRHGGVAQASYLQSMILRVIEKEVYFFGACRLADEMCRGV
jgi:hypothetical protein